MTDWKPARRIKATRDQWDEIVVLKRGACRVCGGHPVTLHHLVPRSQGGDDVADNIVSLCGIGTTGCHGLIEARHETTSMKLGLQLSRKEIAYVLRKKGAYYLADRYRLAFTDDEAKEIAA